MTTLADQNGSKPEVCSFREVIIANNTNADFEGCADPKGSIGFAPGLRGVIKLNGSGLPSTTRDVVIEGSGANAMSISGSNQFRVMDVGPGSTVEIQGLTITDGCSLGTTSEEDGSCPDESGGGIRFGFGSPFWHLNVYSLTQP